MKLQLRHVSMLVLIALVGMLTPQSLSASPTQQTTAQTIPLAISLDNLVSIDATVTVQQAAVQSGKLIVTASVSGTANVRGISATIVSQPITLTVAATCKGGTGTLTLTTSQIKLSLSNGTQATVDPLTVNASASTGGTRELKVTTSPARVALSDGTVLSVSQVTADLTSPPSTQVGSLIGDLHDLICQLADLLAANGDPSQAVTLVNQILTKLISTL
jgi:hypothetical protein